MFNRTNPTWWVIPLIFVSVLAWGGFHAVGAFVKFDYRNVWRPVMVMGCVLTFLLWWGWLLWIRQRRVNAARVRTGERERDHPGGTGS